jgi:hypothetical protein
MFSSQLAVIKCCGGGGSSRSSVNLLGLNLRGLNLNLRGIYLMVVKKQPLLLRRSEKVPHNFNRQATCCGCNLCADGCHRRASGYFCPFKEEFKILLMTKGRTREKELANSTMSRVIVHCTYILFLFSHFVAFSHLQEFTHITTYSEYEGDKPVDLVRKCSIKLSVGSFAPIVSFILLTFNKRHVSSPTPSATMIMIVKVMF